MRLRLVVMLLVTASALLSAAPSARAAPVTYSVSAGNGQGNVLSLDGDQLTALSVTVILTSCTGTGGSNAGLLVTLPSTPVSVNGSTLHVETGATSGGYPDSSASVVIEGVVSADRRLISGTIALSNVQLSADASCAATTQPFVALRPPVVIPPDPEYAWMFTGLSLRANAAAGKVTRLRIVVPFACGDAANSVTFDTRAYGIDELPSAPDGSFGTAVHVLDTYGIVRLLTVSGMHGATTVTTRFQVASTDVGGFLGDCIGDATFSATLVTSAPAAPAPPVSPPSAPPQPRATPPSSGRQTLPRRRNGPSASFDWAQLRLSRGASFAFYFLVDGLRCTGGATHVRIVVNGRPHYASCKRRRAFASGPVAPGADYALTARAVRLRRGRIVRRGPSVVTVLRMRTADDTWRPLAKLPGAPPVV